MPHVSPPTLTVSEHETILADTAGQRRDRVHGLLCDRVRRRGAAPGRSQQLAA